jgi:long-chain fatty acid transport protein
VNRHYRLEEGMMRGLVVCGIVMMASVALANGFRNPPEGAAAFGHSGGKLILTEDASTISHNPANAARMTNSQALVSATLINTETKFSSPMASDTTEDSLKVLPNVFAVMPIENTRYAAGVGLTTPFGQSTVWDKDGAFRYSAPYRAQMTVVNINPTLAARVTDQVSVGVGADVYWSQLDLKQVFPWSAVTGNRMSPDGTVHMKGDGQGVGGNVGLTYRPAPRHAFALTYRSPVKVDYDGDTTFRGMPAGAQAMGFSPSSDFDSSIEFPAVAAVGYAFKLTDTVRLEADVEWIEFSRYDNVALDAGNNNALLHGPGDPNPMGPVVLRQDWKDTWTFGLGADWDVMPEVTLRAGYIYLQSPVPDETLAPTLPDADRSVITVGAGYHSGQQSLDVAYGLSIIGDREIDTNQNPAFNGKYETSSHIVSISYGYNF